LINYVIFKLIVLGLTMIGILFTFPHEGWVVIDKSESFIIRQRNNTTHIITILVQRPFREDNF